MTSPILPPPAEQFLCALDPDAKTFNFRSFPEAPGSKGAAANHPNVPLDDVPALIARCKAEKRGLFVVVNDGGGTDASIMHIRAVFIDLDRKDFDSDESCKAAMRYAHEGRVSKDGLPPAGWSHGSLVVRSGGGGYHLYWLLSEALPVEQFKPMQQALAKRFGGDPAVCNPSRIMRLPGSTHWKSGEPVQAGLALCRPERRYTVSALEEGLGLAVEAEQRTEQPASAADPTQDAVLAWLRENPEWLKSGGRTEPTGPIDVVCPNAAKHSLPDSLTSTVYMPEGYAGRTRGFHCSHAGCAGVTLRDWLRHMGYSPDCGDLGTDDGAACAFAWWLEQRGERAMYARGRWYWWTGTHWRQDEMAVQQAFQTFAEATAKDAQRDYTANVTAYGEAAAKRMTREAAALCQSRKRWEVLKSAAVQLHRRSETLDNNPDLLPCANGVTVNLRTGKAQPSRPEDGFTRCAGVAFHPDAKAPRWERFIAEVFAEDEELVAYSRRWWGYCLTGHVGEETMQIHYGAGMNGKSVMGNVMAHVLGDFAVTASSTLLTGKPGNGNAVTPDLECLVGARLAACNETSEGQRINDAQVKQIVSTEPFIVNPKHRDPYTAQPTAKIVLRTNHRPTVRDQSHGMWRRIHLIPFEQSFTGDRANPEIEAILKAEGPGILRWCIAGSLEWNDGGLAPPEVVVAATEAYRADSDMLGEWLECGEVEHTTTPVTPAGALVVPYNRYSGQHLDAARLGKMLQGRGLKPKRSKEGALYPLRLREDGF